MSKHRAAAGVGLLATLGSALLPSGLPQAVHATEVVVPPVSSGSVPQSRHTVPLGELPPTAPDPGGVDASASSSPAPLAAVEERSGIARNTADSMFPPRGFSVVPPYNGRYICFRHNANNGYWCRMLEGVERLGDRRDFVVGFDSVLKKSDWHATYGRALHSKGGNYYEGCKQRDASSYRCDFRSLNRMAPLTRAQSAGWELRVLKGWSTHYKDEVAPCAMRVVGYWVGNNDLGSVISSCRGAGPYGGYRP